MATLSFLPPPSGKGSDRSCQGEREAVSLHRSGMPSARRLSSTQHRVLRLSHTAARRQGSWSGRGVRGGSGEGEGEE
jgi:hypothetical protein